MHNNDGSIRASFVIDLKKNLKKLLLYDGILFAALATIVLIVLYNILNKYNIYFLNIYYLIIIYAYLSKGKYCGIITTIISYIPGIYLFITFGNNINLKYLLYENVFLTLISIYLIFFTIKKENRENDLATKEYIINTMENSTIFMSACILTDNTIIRSSKSFKNFFRMDETNQTIKLNDLIDKNDLENFNKKKEKLLSNKIKNFEMDIRCNGSYNRKWLKLNAFFIEYKIKKKYIAIFFRDISDFIELRESEEKYRRLIEFLPDAVFIYAQEKIIFVNKAAAKLFGVKCPIELLGYPVLDLIKEEYKNIAKERIKRIYTEGSVPTIEEEFVKIGTNETVRVEVSAISFPYKGLPAIMVIGRDITEKQKLDKMQKDMEINKKMLNETLKYDKLKTDFMANITHDLRTPINIILGSIQLIDLYTKDKNLNEKSYRYLDVIKQNSYRLLRLVNNIIDMSKIDAGFYKLNITNENIIKIVEDITMSVVEYFEDKGIKLIFDTNVEEKLVACDADKIERIMLNLLSNAYKYTEAGGYVYVTISVDDKFINISVKDSGIGIPENKIDSVFDRFVQVGSVNEDKYHGSGIGLSLVKSLVELHNGKIYVKSKLGKGSEFIIKLPDKFINEEINKKLRGPENFDNKIQLEFANVIRDDK